MSVILSFIVCGKRLDNWDNISEFIQAVKGKTMGQIQLPSLVNLRSEFNHFDSSNCEHETNSQRQGF